MKNYGPGEITLTRQKEIFFGIYDPMESVLIYTMEGRPIHINTTELIGTNAIIQLHENTPGEMYVLTIRCKDRLFLEKVVIIK